MATPLLLDTVGRDVEIVPDPLNYLTPAGWIQGWNGNATEVRAIPANPSHSVPDFASNVDVRSITLPYPRVELWGTLVHIESIVGGQLITSNPPEDGTEVMTTAGKWREYGIEADVTYYVVNTTALSFQVSLAPAGVPEALVDVDAPGLTLTIVTSEVLAQLIKARSMYSSPHLIMRLSVHTESDNNRIRHYQSAEQSIGKYQFVLEKLNSDVDEVTFTPTWIRFRALHDQVLRWNLKMPIHVGFATIKGIPVDVYKEDKAFAKDEGVSREWRRSIIVFTVTPYAREAKYTNHFADIRE